MNSYDLYDMDYVLLKNGEIFRVLGNSKDKTCFLGYNVYSPTKDGDRIYMGQKYRKNFIEDEELPNDVMETYEFISTNDVIKKYCPIESVKEQYHTFKDTVWGETYEKLVNLFGEGKVGIFGSSMMGMHLNKLGEVRKDIDYMVEDLKNLKLLSKNIDEIRDKIGFMPISESRIDKQFNRYSRLFNLKYNSLKKIISRRWTALQLSPEVVSTLRFRDKKILTDYLPLTKKRIKINKTVKGIVHDKTGQSNLFPRQFTLKSQDGDCVVSLFWWKYSSPIKDGEIVEIRGDVVDNNNTNHIVLTNFKNHGINLSGKI